MTDLQIANMLADYHKECELAETLREKADVQLKHARLIREALRQPLVSGRSEQLVDFVRWLNEKSYWVRIPDKVVEEYEQYLLYQQKKSTNCH